MRFRGKPPGVVDGPIGSGTLDLPSACARAKAVAKQPLKFTVTGPHMLSKVLLDRHYERRPDLANAIAQVLAGQLAEVDADVLQLDEANIPGRSGIGPARAHP